MSDSPKLRIPLDILETALAAAGVPELNAFMDFGELVDDLASGEADMDTLGPEILLLIPRLAIAFKSLGEVLKPIMRLLPKPDPEKRAARQAERAERKAERKAKRAAKKNG